MLKSETCSLDHKNCLTGNSLAVQWLGLQAFTAEDTGSIPGWGTKILRSHKLRGMAKNKKQKLLDQRKAIYLDWKAWLS